MTMNKYTRILMLLVIFATLVSCSDSPPEFTKFVMKSNQFGMLLETSDSGELSKIHDLFHDRKVENEADAEFFYIIDVTTNEGKTRWQYSKDGYLMAYGTSDSDKTIFRIARVNQFNQLTKIR